jgi:hypothetical protein
MSNTEGRKTVTRTEAVTSRGETSRPGYTARPTEAERSDCAWIEACLERLEGKELRESFYERLERAFFRSS